MGSRKSIGLFIAAIACVGCCAIPISGLIAGITSLGIISALITQKGLDVVLCAMTLVLLMVFVLYRPQRRSRCCPSPDAKCNKTQCNIRGNPSSNES